MPKITASLNGSTDALRRAAERYAGPTRVKAGVLEGAKNDVTGEPVAEYAAKNEFGAPGIPSRPFMRRTVEQKKALWVDGMRRNLADGWTPETVLQQVGAQMVFDIQGTITSNMAPPNSPKTIARKTKQVLDNGRPTGGTMASGTLRDTWSMYNAIAYEVEK